MLHMDRDTYKSLTDSNDFTIPAYNDINLFEHNFMPYFEIRFRKPLPEKYDIIDRSVMEDIGKDTSGWDAFIPIDYEKLSKYI